MVCRPIGCEIADCDGRPNTRKVEFGMNMFWVIAVLEATLFVVAVSLAAAVAADAISRRRHGPDGVEAATSRSKPPLWTIEVVDRVRDWHRVAVRAFAVCITGSVLVVAAVGMLLIVG
jgi:hypothetical protein